MSVDCGDLLFKQVPPKTLKQSVSLHYFCLCYLVTLGNKMVSQSLSVS